MAARNFIQYSRDELVGKSFHWLTVKKFAYVKNELRYWHCICKCGKKKVISTNRLRFSTKSCGCWKTYKLKLRAKHGDCRRTSKVATEYQSWCLMKSRCKKDHQNKKYYFDRGIKVCKRWLDKKNGYKNFLADMGRKPTRHHTLDRKNNDKNYSPSNCRWATRSEQIRNSRQARWIKIDGKTLLLKEWLSFYKITNCCYRKRRKKGWSIKRSFQTPSRNLSFRMS